MINVLFYKFSEKSRKSRESQQKTVKRKLSLSEEEFDSDEDNPNNSALKGLQDGLSQYFTPSNRRKSRNSFNLAEDIDDSNSQVIKLIFVSFDFELIDKLLSQTSEPKMTKPIAEEPMQSTPKRSPKRRRVSEVTKTPVQSTPAKTQVSSVRMSSRKRQSTAKVKQSLTKSPRPVRTPVTTRPKEVPMPISPPMRTLPSNIPTDADKEMFKKAQEVAERQFVTTILTPLKRQPNILCEAKVYLT